MAIVRDLRSVEFLSKHPTNRWHPYRLIPCNAYGAFVPSVQVEFGTVTFSPEATMKIDFRSRFQLLASCGLL